MKQMISNHREIESLQDFIYYDKSTGKIKIKKGVNLIVSDGEISKVLGVDSSGNMVKGTVSGGTQLYLHTFVLGTYYVRIISTNPSYSNVQFVIGDICLYSTGDGFYPTSTYIGIFAFDGSNYSLNKAAGSVVTSAETLTNYEVTPL